MTNCVLITLNGMSSYHFNGSFPDSFPIKEEGGGKGEEGEVGRGGGGGIICLQLFSIDGIFFFFGKSQKVNCKETIRRVEFCSESTLFRKSESTADKIENSQNMTSTNHHLSNTSF